MTPEQLRAAVVARYERHWAATLTGGGELAFWLPLTELQRGWRERPAELVEQAKAVTAWAQRHKLEIEQTSRKVSGRLTLSVPRRIWVPSLQVAAAIAGKGAHLAAARARHERLTAVGAEVSANSLKRAVALRGHDFDHLCRAVTWGATRTVVGMTPRQVTIEDVHGKWLEKHASLLAALLGRQLDLEQKRSWVRFAYLDTTHRSTGRRYDSHVIGDLEVIQYQPELVVAVENLDTMIGFPELPRAVCVFAGGDAAGQIARIEWVRAARRIIYWGDIDADGYAILNDLRASGLAADSILMGRQHLDRYRAAGTAEHPDGSPIARSTRALPQLTADEQAAYCCLNAADWDGPRRIEQERIPFEHALETLGEFGLGQSFVSA